MNRLFLNNLEKRNNSLKSKLFHKQLKYDNFTSDHNKKYMLLVLNDYKKYNSLYKAALNNNIDFNLVLRWFVQGQLGNPQYRGFYLAILKNNSKLESCENENAENYVISPYGDGWSYKTFINGEKIFIIANELDDLKKKVKAKNLPLD